MRRLLRPLCWLFGHGGTRMYSLPEEEFGLYAFSRLECMRCLATIASNPNPRPLR